MDQILVHEGSIDILGKYHHILTKKKFSFYVLVKIKFCVPSVNSKYLMEARSEIFVPNLIFVVLIE